MAQARIGSRVKVRYTGKFKNGTLFDVSCSHEPMEFTLGHGEVLKDFEEAVLGMEPGDSKTITLPPKEGLEAQAPKMADEEAFNLRTIKGGEKDEALRERGHPFQERTLVFDVQVLEVS